ncbi:MAG: homocysteine S-methyltransferase family protein [Eubacteriales bacterium]|nr:homocysteine S-methyltransferase family protein [Eubacteriales bacterium]
MQGILQAAKNQILFFDGAMGTMLQAAGLSAGELPEVWNITHPEVVRHIHESYLAAGANILKTNTFGNNAIKLKDSGYTVSQAARAAVENAKAAINNTPGDTPRFVAYDVGPTGKLLQPLGDLAFEAAYQLFREGIEAGAAAGADAILIETMSDTYELKAAVLAAKETTDLPVYATVSPDRSGRLLSGGDMAAVAALLEGLRVDGLGLNCGMGPVEMLPILQALSQISDTPLILNPNAGLPKECNGKTVYDVAPEEFAAHMEQAVAIGVQYLGGCCGTTPAHIGALVKHCNGIRPQDRPVHTRTVIASYGHGVAFENATVLIGERINPTGKPKLKEALRKQDMDYILQEGVRQQQAGAQVLDVNAGLPEIDETATLCRMVQELQGVTDLPLCIDTASPAAMEQALRLYNGKALINSVNGKRESMEAIFPLVQRYGGVVIALTLDEAGIPETAEGRVTIARRIIDTAATYGIQKRDIIVDPLTMTISAGGNNAVVTLEAMERIQRELGVKTSLGVSNVSFGLPERERVNTAFFAIAMGKGLSAAICNPLSERMMDAWRAANALLARDDNCSDYIAAYGGQTVPVSQAEVQAVTLMQAVSLGLRAQAAQAAKEALNTIPPLTVIEEQMIPALNAVGEEYESGKRYLPQLLMSAEAAKDAFSVLRGAMGAAGSKSLGTVILATVQGDVHDIGKNIVKAVLENYNFHVVDLGRDVPPETVVHAAREHQCRLVGLSALMTTTVKSMEKTISLLREALPNCHIMTGGAVLTEEYAASIGSDCYAKDAMASVRFAQQVFGI